MKSIQKISFFFLFLFSMAGISTPAFSQESPLLSDQSLERHGLKRGWFNQIEINPKRSKVLHALLEGGTLFLVSDDSKLHALDAETGKPLWIRYLGNREMLLQEPSANSRMVAVVNGLELFVFNRKNGKMLLQTTLPGAAAAACEMSENYVYIPMLDDRIVAFPLEDTSIRFEDDPSAASAAAPAADPDAAPAPEPVIGNDQPAAEENKSQGDDPVLDHIKKSFEATKKSVLGEAEPPKKEKEFQLREAIGIPLTCQTMGRTLVKPTLSTQLLSYSPKGMVRMHREILTWSIDEGALLAAGIESLSPEYLTLRYMVDSSSQTYYLGSDRIAQRDWNQNKGIVIRPTANQCVPFLYIDNRSKAIKIPSMVVVGNKMGYVFAVKDRTGEVAWQFAASGPVLNQIAVVGTDVYCPTSTGAMHAIDLLTGKEKWSTGGIVSFVAASLNRLYVVNQKTELVVLDRKTGNAITSFDARSFDLCLFNIHNDRVYLVNRSGLVQCLYERQANQSDDFALSQKPPKPIKHRLTCADYAKVLFGKEVPELYWMKEDAGEGDAAAAPGEVPVDAGKSKPSGEDGNLDGNEFPNESKPKKDEKPKQEKKDESDPFS